MSADSLNIKIVGVGIFGLWQALLLARAGHRVHAIDRSTEPFSESASQYAGAMIAPFCEAESAEPVVRDLGFAAADIWRAHYPDLIECGSLVVAQARDQSELKRFARMTRNHELIDDRRIGQLEPDLAGRFHTALFYPDEAHMITPSVLHHLVELAQQAGATFTFGADAAIDGAGAGSDIIIDCRGMAARDVLPDLRGVRGERLLIRTQDITLNRAIRLLHPRYPLYAVPWDGGRILIGATVIESEDSAPMTVRSALELLGMAYALHPALGEAEIVEMSAGIRPAFPDNIPRVILRDNGKRIFVNGAFRHGFLLAPMLATVTRDVLARNLTEHPLLRTE